MFALDDDVNIYDVREVLWAIATKKQWDEDLIMVENYAGAFCHSLNEDYVTTKAGIEVTKNLASNTARN